MNKMKQLSKIFAIFTLIFTFWAANAAFADDSSNNNTIPEQIKCIVEVSKTSIWNNYDVQIHMYNLSTRKQVMTLDLPKTTDPQKGLVKTSKEFSCEDNENITFTATFTPAIWSNEANKEYQSTNTWNLINLFVSRTQHADKLIIKVGFPDDFVEVPQPITTPVD